MSIVDRLLYVVLYVVNDVVVLMVRGSCDCMIVSEDWLLSWWIVVISFLLSVSSGLFVLCDCQVLFLLDCIRVVCIVSLILILCMNVRFVCIVVLSPSYYEPPSTGLL